MKARLLFPTLAALAFAAHAAATDIEPTAQDYGLIDSAHVGGLSQAKPVFQWIDIASTGARVVGPGADLSSNHSQPDGVGEPITLPQPFPFYGSMITEIVPSSNGYLSTDPDEAGTDGVPQCPPAAPAIGKGDRINVLHSPQLGIGGVFYQYFELSPHPHRRCGVSVFSWIDFKFGDGGASYQALLFDTGDILMQYAAGNSGTAADATIGLQEGKGNEGIAYRCGGSLAAPAGVAVLFRSPMVVVENGSPILYGKSLAEGIAEVRNGGRIRFSHDSWGQVGFEDTDPNRPPNDPDDDPDETDLIILPATITLNKSVVIDGASGFSNAKTFTRKEIDCNGRLGFDIGGNGRLLLVSTGIINGAHTTSGGAIRVNGALKLCDTNVHHNRNQLNNGGAIAVFGSGSAWLCDSNFYENSARANGGAVYSEGRGLRIDRCAFFHNEARGRGGAVALDVASTSSLVTNTTFAYNRAGISSSAVESLESNTIMRHCTVAENGDADAPSAGVLGADEGTMSFSHCIIGPNREPALNTNGATFTSGGYNLDDSGTFGASGTLGFSNLGDVIGESKLTPLGLHGGRVFTMMPLISSNALDQGRAGLSNPPLADARGLPRVLNSDSVAGARIDIGAVEGGELVVVDTANDEFALFPGGNTAATSLEEAIVSAPEGGRIIFHSSLSGARLDVQHYYDPATCQPV
ncbi:MAG: right-handed parallel beta-helix repeat-containing protein, partial [Verrucomicrobiales bacterium]